ncbi:MAG: hypothetical protein ACLQPD_13755 [Desulfomonilaceae bacterium]
MRNEMGRSLYRTPTLWRHKEQSKANIGVDNAGHIKEEIVDMVHLNETL